MGLLACVTANMEMHTYSGRISMLFSPLSGRSLARPASVIGVFWLAAVYRLSFGCLAHACDNKRLPATSATEAS